MVPLHRSKVPPWQRSQSGADVGVVSPARLSGRDGVPVLGDVELVVIEHTTRRADAKELVELAEARRQGLKFEGDPGVLGRVRATSAGAAV